MKLEDVKLNIEEAIHEYEKINICNLYYQNIKDLKLVLEWLKEID